MILITIEGIDGSGKSSIIDMLKDDSEFCYEFNPIFTHEPIGKKERFKASSASVRLYLFMEDHKKHLYALNSVKSSERLVICDRYTDSRCAYQSVETGKTVSEIRQMHPKNEVLPDKTIFLDVSPDVAVQRCSKKGDIESIERLHDVAVAYNKIIDSEPSRFVRIDANRPIESVFSDVKTEILLAADKPCQIST